MYQRACTSGLLMMLSLPLVAAGAGPWSSVPLSAWTEAVTTDACTEGMPVAGLPKVMPADGRAAPPVPQPPFGKWEEKDGALAVHGLAPCWSTMLAPGERAGALVTVRFRIDKSSGAARQLPGGCVRWGFHWGENLPGWDFGVVLGYRDPLSFCRVQVSAARGELALWDSNGGFLQIIPCAALKAGTDLELAVAWRGDRLQAWVNGKLVMDYWQRGQRRGAGQVGLAVWQSDATVAQFTVAAPDAKLWQLPAHVPAFRFEPTSNIMTGHPGFHMEPASGVILFDGNEPISYFWKQPVDQGGEGSRGTLFHEAVKLEPGGRPVYYTYIGPNGANWIGKWAMLAGELPAAFKVQEQGKTLAFAFRTEDQGIAATDYVCTVRYDEKRGVYRYEYRGKTVFSKPGKTNEFELFDPLVYNNRAPGPEVKYRWASAGHRWWVHQTPAGDWRRMPLADYSVGFSTDYCNAELPWPKALDFLYPAAVGACPAFETEVGWAQPPGRHLFAGQCNWGYDYHHREVGSALELPAGTERSFAFTFTALPAPEAETIAKQAGVMKCLEKEARALIPFNPAGTTFAERSSWAEPTTTMVWEGAGALDEKVGHGDSRSLRLEAPGKAVVMLYQYAIEQHAPAWEVRGWLRSQDVKGTCRLRVKYAYGKEPEDLFVLDAAGTREWTAFRFRTLAPRAKDCTQMSFELEGTGRVWLDDVAVTAVHP